MFLKMSCFLNYLFQTHRCKGNVINFINYDNIKVLLVKPLNNAEAFRGNFQMRNRRSSPRFIARLL